LQGEGHHAGHHDHASGSRRLRALLVDLNSGLVQHLGHKNALGRLQQIVELGIVGEHFRDAQLKVRTNKYQVNN